MMIITITIVINAIILVAMYYAINMNYKSNLKIMRSLFYKNQSIITGEVAIDILDNKEKIQKEIQKIDKIYDVLFDLHLHEEYNSDISNWFFDFRNELFGKYDFLKHRHFMLTKNESGDQKEKE